MNKQFENNELNFREIEMYRKPELNVTDELVTLYKECIDQFVINVSKLSNEELETEIESPLNGKPTKQKDWFAQNVMHTLHHVGQAVRIQGIVDRKLTNNPVSYNKVKGYTNLFVTA